MLSYQKLDDQMKAGIYSPVYLFFGEEAYLREERIAKLARSYLGSESEFGLEKVDGDSLSPAELVSRLDEGGLFARKRLLVVSNPPYLAASRKKEEIQEGKGDSIDTTAEGEDFEALHFFLNRPEKELPEAILVFSSPGADKRKKLYKLIDKKAAVVECSSLKGQDLEHWIEEKAAVFGKKFDRQALDRLLLAGSNNLHYLSAEIEKYSNYVGENEKVISSSVVENLFAGDLQSSVFWFADALAEKKLLRADNLLQLLLARREKALSIFFLVVRHYRLLLQARGLIDEGLPPGQFPQALEVQPFVARKLRDQALLYETSILEDIILVLQKTDLQIKTGSLEPEQALNLLLNRIDYLQKSV